MRSGGTAFGADPADLLTRYDVLPGVDLDVFGWHVPVRSCHGVATDVGRDDHQAAIDLVGAGGRDGAVGDGEYGCAERSGVVDAGVEGPGAGEGVGPPAEGT